VFLGALAGVAGFAYQNQLDSGGRADSDPDFWDHVLAFQELVLRYGAAVALWGVFGGLVSDAAKERNMMGSQGSPVEEADLGAAGIVTGFTGSRPLKRFVDRAAGELVLEMRAWELGLLVHHSSENDGRDDQHAADADLEGEPTDEGAGLLPGLHMTMWRAIGHKMGWRPESIGREIDRFVVDVVTRTIDTGSPATMDA
jgi:hypothetical protein